MPPINTGDRKELGKLLQSLGDGVEQYEVETVLNGNARDFDVDSKGAR